MTLTSEVLLQMKSSVLVPITYCMNCCKEYAPEQKQCIVPYHKLEVGYKLPNGKPIFMETLRKIENLVTYYLDKNVGIKPDSAIFAYASTELTSSIDYQTFRIILKELSDLPGVRIRKSRISDWYWTKLTIE